MKKNNVTKQTMPYLLLILVVLGTLVLVVAILVILTMVCSVFV